MIRVEDTPPPYDTVVFDCDSTLSAMEGIEELAGDSLKGSAGEELAELTRAAMDGELPLEKVYGRRLELVEPTRTDLARIGEMYVEHALPHARALCDALHGSGKIVHIVSGGLLPAVRHFGELLGVPAARIRAVDLSWNEDGSYAGFEEDSPLARAGGKIDVLRGLAEHGAGAMALVGDGATDLEAAPLTARFIAFGGVERRDVVFQAARVRCEAPDLAALVPLLFSDSELETLRRTGDHADLLAAAAAYV